MAARLGRQTDEAQGTTEYAILVGVLVVIAIVAIIALRPQIQSLWQIIVDGMGQLSSLGGRRWR